MNGRQRQSLDQAIAWAKRQKHRSVEANYPSKVRTGPDDESLSLYISDQGLAEGAYLPDGYVGNISTYLCEKRIISLESSRDYINREIKKMSKVDCEEAE